MNVVVWVLQVLLALAFLVAGVTKATQPRQKLAASMGWVEDFSDNTVRTIGVLEILAGVALLLPAVTGVATVLVPLAAVGAPTLVLQGDRDEVTLEHGAAVAAALPKGRLAVLPGTHLLPVENPEVVNALLLWFLRGDG